MDRLSPSRQASADQTSEDQPAQILIVDDDPHSRQLLEVMLSHDGYALLPAANGPDALAIVAERLPDLVLLDVTMPGMDGYQVASQIKRQAATQSIPIILVTALDGRSARMLGLGAGADDFLSKPVDRAELSVRVRNLLRQSSGERRKVDVPKPPTSGPPTPPRPERTSISEELVRLCNQLTPAWQQTILGIVRGIHAQVMGPRDS